MNDVIFLSSILDKVLVTLILSTGGTIIAYLVFRQHVFVEMRNLGMSKTRIKKLIRERPVYNRIFVSYATRYKVSWILRMYCVFYYAFAASLVYAISTIVLGDVVLFLLPADSKVHSIVEKVLLLVFGLSFIIMAYLPGLSYLFFFLTHPTLKEKKRRTGK